MIPIHMQAVMHKMSENPHAIIHIVHTGTHCQSIHKSTPVSCQESFLKL